MFKLFYVLGLFICSSCFISSNLSDIPDKIKVNRNVYFDTLYLPKIDSTQALVEHYAYCLLYDEYYEQAKWVFYSLNKNKINGPFSRSDKFKKDTLIKTGSASHSDYKGSGYDRGHLAPAADMAWSKQAMDESFFYSNMSPQTPSFNRGVWRKLESRIRKWVVDYDSLYITTGPILDSNLTSIGNELAVPDYFFKSIIGFKDSTVNAIAFILPNEGSKKNLEDFVVSIDSLETFSGLNFNAGIENTVQDSLEKSIQLNYWNFD